MFWVPKILETTAEKVLIACLGVILIAHGHAGTGGKPDDVLSVKVSGL